MEFTKREHQARSQGESSLLIKCGRFLISVKKRVGLIIVGFLSVLISNRTLITFVPSSFPHGMKSNMSQNVMLQMSVSKHWDITWLGSIGVLTLRLRRFNRMWH